MKKQGELLQILGIVIGAFLGAVIMMSLIGSDPINWLLAFFFAAVFGLVYAILTIAKPRNSNR